MRLAIISDTHLPRATRALPEACLARLRAADLILHAGAFQLFNPGSPTDRRRQPRHTMGEADVAGGRVAFTLVDLG